MHVVDHEECEEFVSGDGAVLRELLHPDKAELELGYSLAHAVVRPGESTSAHRLAASEVYYIIEGKGLMSIDDEAADLGPRQAVYIPPGAMQSITNTGSTDLVFLCIVDPAWSEEYERIY